MRLAILLPAFVAAALAGACGDEDKQSKVDASEVERQIEQDLSSSTAAISSVSCPDDVENETGAKFTCSAKFDGGGSAKVAVTESEAPDQFTYSFKPGTVKLAGASVDAALEKDLAATGIPDATVDCPDTVAVKPDTTVSCPVSGARGGAGAVTFEFTDASGTIDEVSLEG